MAFEKAKVIKAAEKFLAQGKISAAIKEYRQIIEHDDSDLTTLNMLGDLLARAGENEEAISCFQRIAEHYREKEFRLKAIAMYRKVEKLKPRDPAIAKELGDLYAAQGLIADARIQYLVVADAYTRAGDSRNTLKVLHRIADLDPHNTEIRLKLAQGYFKEGMLTEAAKAFSEAAHRLLENAEFEKSLAAFSKTLELRPHDMAALKGLVSAHAALGTADEAAEILEKVVAETPDDPELVSMLAQAYVEAEDAAGAERATAMLMAEDASNYRRYIEVGLVHLKLGQEDEAARIVGIVIEPMLAAREENDLLELVNELLTRNPEHVPSLRLMARIHWWQRDMEKLRAVLERLAESAEAAGLADDERYALTQLVRLAPDEQRYFERLNVLGGVLEDVTDGDQQGDPSLASVPSFEGFEIIGETEADAPPAEGSEFEWNSVAEESPARAEVSFADLNETGAQADGESQGTDPFASGVESAAHRPSATEKSVDGGAKGPSSTAMMHQELESVDFYIKQNYTDIALDTLDLLERQFGPHPEISSRRESLKGSEAGSGTPVSESAEQRPSLKEDSEIDIAFGDIKIGQPLSGSEVRRGKDPVVEAPASVASGIDSGLAEIFEEFRIEAEGESGASKEDYETHYNMATAYKEMDLLDEAIREFQTATGLTAVGTQRYFECCNMLGHCFVQKGMPQAAVLWFKKGLDSPGRSPEEYKALQYELGTAYEEMGELTDAVAAFTEVYGVDVSYRDIADKLESLQARVATEKKKRK